MVSISETLRDSKLDWYLFSERDTFLVSQNKLSIDTNKIEAA